MTPIDRPKPCILEANSARAHTDDRNRPLRGSSGERSSAALKIGQRTWRARALGSPENPLEDDAGVPSGSRSSDRLRVGCCCCCCWAVWAWGVVVFANLCLYGNGATLRRLALVEARIGLWSGRERERGMRSGNRGAGLSQRQLGIRKTQFDLQSRGSTLLPQHCSSLPCRRSRFSHSPFRQGSKNVDWIEQSHGVSCARTPTALPQG